MGFKCVTQIMALVRGDGMRRDGKGQAKHRANAGAIIGEAFEISDPEDGHPIPIRKSASETYDKARTVNNRYEGYQTADDVIAALEEAADAHKVPVERKSKKTGKVETHYRALPPDAVIGIAVIHKPPCAVARTWTPEQYEKYIKDSREVMELIQCGGQTVKGSDEFKRGREPCRLFAQKNRIASAMHWDEGSEDNEDLPEEEGTIYAGHWHDIFIPEDENGLYRGNLIDAYFLSHVSAVYPAMMRERGWDIDECDCTRWDLFAQDKDYREERKRKIKEGGRSVNKHRERMRRKKTDAKLEEAQGILDQAIETKRDVEGYAERTRTDAEAEAERIIAGAKKEKADIETDIANLAKERVQAVRDRDTAKGEQRDAEQARNAALEAAAIAEGRIEMKKQYIGILQVKIDALNEAKKKAVAERDAARQEAKELKDAHDKAVADKTAAETEARDVMKKLGSVRTELGEAMSERDAARREADELRRTMVEQAQQAAVEASKAMRDRIETNTRKAWDAWLEKKKAKAEATAAEIVAAAVEAVQGDFAPFIRWLSAQTYKSGANAGKTWFQGLFGMFQNEVRAKRLKAMPSDVRGAGQRQAGADRDAPVK